LDFFAENIRARQSLALPNEGLPLEHIHHALCEKFIGRLPVWCIYHQPTFAAWPIKPNQSQSSYSGELSLVHGWSSALFLLQVVDIKLSMHKLLIINIWK
jgi:hypothetical protein